MTWLCLLISKLNVPSLFKNALGHIIFIKKNTSFVLTSTFVLYSFSLYFTFYKYLWVSSYHHLCCYVFNLPFCSQFLCPSQSSQSQPASTSCRICQSVQSCSILWKSYYLFNYLFSSYWFVQFENWSHNYDISVDSYVPEA